MASPRIHQGNKPSRVLAKAAQLAQPSTQPQKNAAKPADTSPVSELNKENAPPESPVVAYKKEPVDAGAKKRRPSSCVFVASLRSTRTDDELCSSVTAHFEPYGELVSVKVLRDPANRPYAFVQYTNDSDCRLAIQNGHNSELDGRRLRCEAAKVNRTLFISAYRQLSRAELVEEIKQFGETEIVAPSTQYGRVVTANTGAASNNWFVKFSYRDDAIRAFASLADNMDFHVEWAQNIDDVAEKPCQFDKFGIFVGQLPLDVTEEKLRDHFSVHGAIRELSLVQKQTSSFAFITFGHETAAASAVARDNHSMFMQKTIHVQYREVSNRGNSRVILSPRVPVALAPPPIHLRKRYPGIIPKFAVAQPIDAGQYDVFPSQSPGGGGNLGNGASMRSRFPDEIPPAAAKSEPEGESVYYYIPKP